MNEAQYRQLVHNSQPRGVKTPLGEETLHRIVGAAARNVKRREQARLSLEKLLDADLYEGCQVTLFAGGVLEIEARDRIRAEQLTRMRQSLKKQLMQRLPGLQRLNIRRYGETGGLGEEDTEAEALSE